MIINKEFEELKATIYYQITFKGLAHDDEVLDEFVTVRTFDELLKHLGEFGIKKMKEEYDSAASIKISGIEITSDKKEDTSISVQLHSGRKMTAYATTKIENEDIENRMMTNLQQVKRIIDNTLSEYPIKY